MIKPIDPLASISTQLKINKTTAKTKMKLDRNSEKTNGLRWIHHDECNFFTRIQRKIEMECLFLTNML